MKKIANRALMGLLLLTVTACEKDLKVFDDPVCRLNFHYREARSTADFKPQYAQSSYSFIYKSDQLERDTSTPRSWPNTTSCRPARPARACPSSSSATLP